MLNLKSDQAKQREARAQLRLIQSAEQRMHGALGREINRAVALAASSYPEWRSTLSLHKRNLQVILERFGSETAQASAQRTLATFKKACPWKIEKKLDTNKSLLQRITDWARGNATKAKGIADTTKERISNAIAYGIGKNESPEEIAGRIVTHVGSMSSARAFTIARTESQMAHNVGQQYSTESAEREFNITLTKTWVATEDARTRETHTKADGQTVPLKKKFHVGKSWLMFPGDPNGPPGEIINCRCVPVYNS